MPCTHQLTCFAIGKETQSEKTSTQEEGGQNQGEGSQEGEETSEGRGSALKRLFT